MPFGSIYVKNHYQKLKELSGLAIDKHVIKRKNTSRFGSVAKYLWCFVSFVTKLPRNYDVVHVHFLSPVYLLACIYKIRKPDCRIVVTFHGSDINELSHPFWLRFYKQLLRFNDVSIAVGEELKKRADHLLGINVDYVICAGFNDGVFWDKNIPYKNRDIDFLYVGSFLPVKGLDTIIETIKIVNHPEIRFLFVGAGEMKDKLEALSRYGNVKVKDGLPQEQLNDLYNRAKFFILASRKEGFGLAITEAMYCGAPVLVRDIPQLRHQVTEGENGFLFEDENELADLISTCYEMTPQKWNLLSENGKQRSKSYSLSAVIEAMHIIYTRDIK